MQYTIKSNCKDVTTFDDIPIGGFYKLDRPNGLHSTKGPRLKTGANSTFIIDKAMTSPVAHGHFKVIELEQVGPLELRVKD